jgi:hypothetical protein
VTAISKRSCVFNRMWQDASKMNARAGDDLFGAFSKLSSQPT